MPRCQPHRRGERDHRAVVGAERQLGEVHPGAALRRMPRRRRARSAAFAPTPPATTSRSQSGRRERGHRLAHQHVDDRRLRRRREVGARLLAASSRACAACVRTAVFRPAKRSRASRAAAAAAAARRPRGRRTRRAAPAPARPGSRGRAAWPTCRTPRRRRRRSCRRAARSGRRRRRGAAACGRPRRAARRTESAGGSAEQERRQQVAFEVVDAERRLAERGGERAGDAGADEQRAGQPGPARVGDDVEVRQPTAGVVRAPRAPAAATRRMWSRDASSGTTPPYAACSVDLAVQRLGDESRRLVGRATRPARRRSRRTTFRCPGRSRPRV